MALGEAEAGGILRWRLGGEKLEGQKVGSQALLVTVEILL